MHAGASTELFIVQWARGKGSSPGRVEGSSRAMLATARPSCTYLLTYSTVLVACMPVLAIRRYLWRFPRFPDVSNEYWDILGPRGSPWRRSGLHARLRAVATEASMLPVVDHDFTESPLSPPDNRCIDARCRLPLCLLPV